MGTTSQRMMRYGGVKLSQRLRRSIPILGTVIAVATVAATIRRKGVVSGTLDTGLNALPLVGALKNAAEMLRGRDFFPDRFPVDRSTGMARGQRTRARRTSHVARST